MFLGADDVRDLHVVVVDHRGKMIQAGAVVTLYHVVLFACPGEANLSADEIADDKLAFAWHLQPNYTLSTFAGKSLGIGICFRHPSATIGELRARGLRRFALGLNFLGRGEIAVGMATGQQLCNGGLIFVAPLGLIVRRVGPPNSGAFVPIQAEPFEPMQNRRESCFDVTLLIGIVDAQEKLPAMLPGEEPVEQGRANSADVEVAGGTGGESRANSHECLRGLRNKRSTMAKLSRDVYRWKVG